MDKYDLLDAMGGIRDEYIEEASGPDSRKAQAGSRRRKVLGMQRWAAAAAALLCLSVIVPNVSPDAASAFKGIPLFGNYFRAVTFRAYEYEGAGADAYVEEPAVVTMSAGEVKVEDEAEAAAASGEENGPAAAGAGDPDADAGSGTPDAAAGSAASERGEAAAADAYAEKESADSAAGEDGASIQAALSAAEITREVRRMAEREVESFERSLREETGYHTLRFLHETVTDTDRWFCLEVYCFTSAADGFEQVTHFNIDKETGERVTLEDWFGEGTQYIGPVSENIRAQMRAQMAKDPDVEYWLDSEEEPEYDFREILPVQDCYFDADGNLVICFNQGEAAPMYMGPVEFTIPQEVTEALRR